MVRLTAHIEIIKEHEVRLDEDTTSTFVTAQLLNGEDWFKPLVIRRLQPAYAARAERFCAALEHWTVYTAQLGFVCDVVRDGDPFAIQDYPGEHTLAEFVDVPLSPQLHARIIAVIHGGLATLHAAGIAHGDVRPGSVALNGYSGDVLLMVGRPWCERAAPAEDLRQAAALCARLTADPRGAASVSELVSRQTVIRDAPASAAVRRGWWSWLRGR
jgi:serine/threonine protein kinase